MPPKHRKPGGTGTSVEIGHDQLANLQTQINFNADDAHEHVVVLAGGIGGVASDLETTKTNLDVVTADVKTVDEKVGSLSTDLQTVNIKVTTVEAKVDTVTAKVDSIDMSIKSLKAVG